MELTLTVNGERITLEARADEMLIEVLRRQLGLRSVRETCGIGVCGTCTVLLDGKAISACLLLAPLAAGRAVVTAEGLVGDPVLQAFSDAHAYQCGWCTPGFVLTVRSLLDENASPSVEQTKEALAGNLCRCGSYVKILDAVRAVSR